MHIKIVRVRLTKCASLPIRDHRYRHKWVFCMRYKKINSFYNHTDLMRSNEAWVVVDCVRNSRKRYINESCIPSPLGVGLL